MTADELLAAVYDAPDDDAPRAVYADYLQERGDPRGELIALQLAPAQTPKSLRRQATLIKAHREAWLGPLWRVVNRREIHFERGFVAGLRLSPRIPAKLLADVVGDRRWTTVRSLDTAHDNHRELVLHDVLRGVHRLLDVHPDLALALLVDERPRGLRELSVQDLGVGALLREALGTAAGVPNLRHLGINRGIAAEPATFAWLWASPLGRRLESLSLPFGRPSPAWRTSTAVPRNIAAVHFGEGPLDVTTLRRGPSGLLDQLEEPLR